MPGPFAFLSAKSCLLNLAKPQQIWPRLSWIESAIFSHASWNILLLVLFPFQSPIGIPASSCCLNRVGYFDWNHHCTPCPRCANRVEVILKGHYVFSIISKMSAKLGADFSNTPRLWRPPTDDVHLLLPGLFHTSCSVPQSGAQHTSAKWRDSWAGHSFPCLWSREEKKILLRFSFLKQKTLIYFVVLKLVC